MTAALAITLREGMEAALVLGIILAYLRRTGRTYLNKYVYWGLGFAVLVSILAGIVIQIIGLEPENEYVEGTLLSIGGVFVASMVIWMWKTAKNIRTHMETRMENIVTEEKTSRQTAIGLLAFTFFMVAREGVETVLFLAAATVGQEASVLNLLGGMLGIALAALFAVLFIRGSLKINMSRFFTVTSIVLLILAARLLVGGIHEFAEKGAIPLTPGIMKVVGFFVRDRVSSLLLMGLILVRIIMVLLDFHQAVPTPVADGASAAERRKVRAGRRWEKVWQSSLVSATVIIVLVMASEAFAASPQIDPAPQPVASSTGTEIRLSTDGWVTGELHKFSYEIENTAVRFIASKLSDGNIATALDACQICGIKGYMQERDGDVVICKVCNAPIPMNTMGQGGGCNPLPLASRTEGTTLVIPLKGLQSHIQLFH
ncbi:MAG: Fe-S-containing protein [Dehalococcoidia bacterium]|nr:Fe-S-containing protein [Dehalococcoidia bacterium]